MDEQDQTFNQLLTEIDTLDEHHEVVILAATNHPDAIDTTLLHPGRFNLQFIIGLPDLSVREGILRIQTRQLNLAKNVNLGRVARTTTGFSGADLANLCNEAALTAARKNKERVDMSDFEEALDRILINSPRKLLLNEHERRIAAYHEAGHALVAWLSPEVAPLRKVTIVPQGPATLNGNSLPGDDPTSYSKDYLLARLAVLLGGRAAEEVVIGQVTTGGENDLFEATRLARRMVTRWGMGRLGPVALEPRNEQLLPGNKGRNYSEETAARIDQDIQDLLKTRAAAVKKILNESRSQLDQLVEALLQEETVTQSEMVRILGPRPYESADHPNQPVEVTDLHQKTNIL
jgi:cell division protease FtsH